MVLNLKILPSRADDSFMYGPENAINLVDVAADGNSIHAAQKAILENAREHRSLNAATEQDFLAERGRDPRPMACPDWPETAIQATMWRAFLTTDVGALYD